jgi:hypothetical protein
MRGWVCRLQLLLALASAVIPRSESRGTHDHILLSQIRDSPNLEGQVPYLYPPGTGWPGCNPRNWVPFSSPPTTRRATVEIFNPATTWENSLTSKPASVITSTHGTRRNTVHGLIPIVSMGIRLFAKALLSNGCVYLLIINLLLAADVVSLFILRSLYSNRSTRYNITSVQEN